MDWNLILTVISLMVNVIVTIALFYIGSKASKIDSLESKLEEATRRHVDERFVAATQQCVMRHASLDDRLKSGDRHFAEAREAEKQLARDVADVRENMATRNDLSQINSKLDAVVTTVSSLTASVSSIQGRLTRHEPSAN